MPQYIVTKRITLDYIHTGVEASSMKEAQQILDENGAEAPGLGSSFEIQVVKETYKATRIRPGENRYVNIGNI